MPRPQTPALAADAIIELLDFPARPIVLIERKNPPPGWAIPGGFVDIGESVPVAAVREALEETSLEVDLDVRFRELHARRAAVDDAADRRPVALAE